MTPGSTIGEADWAQCEAVIRRFEDAWREHKRPVIEDFLAVPTPHASHLLVELVHVDLDVRLRSGEDAWAEDYLDRFPPLRTPDRTLDLLAAEFALRSRHRPPVWPEYFWLRFPELMPELRARLPAADRPDGPTSTRPHHRSRRPLAGPPEIPGYEILDELGRGGMGVVYRARDRNLNRIVAIKTFATVPRPEERARFAREAEAIAHLDHPHIVPVYEVGEWRAGDGPAVPYFVMKWYPGGNLDAAPAGPGTPPAAHARTVERIARSVHHAHERGILHRDLKPSNILLDDAGRPHVADFGLAGRVDAETTASGVVAGTPSYMAPEQLKDPKGVSVATDVYGLGAILYHQLTGVAPFLADSPLRIFSLVESTPVGPPSAANPAVTRDLDIITRKCLEKNPANRYANAAELADDLERWRTGVPITARPVPTWEHAWRRVRRHPLIAGLSASTLLALVAAVVVLADSNARIRQKERETSDALTRERLLLGQIQESFDREQRALYLERVATAGRLYAANQLPQAWAQLDLCPLHLRGWEWRYLDSLRQLAPRPATHPVYVVGAGFLPDGRLASVDAQGAVRLWDAAGETPTQTWTVNAYPVMGVHFHPTRNWIGLATHNVVSVVDADTGRVVARPAGSLWVAFSPNGKLAATGQGHTVKLWSLPAWEPAGELRGHDLAVLTGTFHPDGRHLLTGSSDCTIRTWDLESRAEVRKRTVPLPALKLAVTSDGTALAECYLGMVLLTDPASGTLRDRIDHPKDERTVVTFHPDTNAIAVGGPNGEVVVWDAGRRKTLRVFRGHTTRVSYLAFGPDGRLASAAGNTMNVWDLNREQEGRMLAQAGGGNGKILAPGDGSRLVVGPRIMGNPNDSWMVVLDSRTGRELHRARCAGDVADGVSTGHVIAGRPGNGFTAWDPATGAEVWRQPRAEDPAAKTEGGNNCRVAVSRDGSRLATWEFPTREIVVRNPADGSPVERIPAGGEFVYVMTFNPDGTGLLVASKQSTLLWDVRARTSATWRTGSGILLAQFRPTGRWLATVESDRTINLRDAETGEIVRPFVGTTTGVTSLEFSPDGTRLATGGTDKLVRIWDVESGVELLALPGATETIQSVAWDRSGSRVYALDEAVRVWSFEKR